MNYHAITSDDMLNGSGLRVVLWVSGCEHNCRHCHNPQTHDIQSGGLFEQIAKDRLFTELSKDYIKGITFSGGDPLHPQNIPTVTQLSQEIREKFPEKDQWLYTGMRWKDILESPEAKQAIQFIDVLVDGEFVEQLADVKTPWCGSTNQMVIDVQRSLELGQIVLYNERRR